jgi:hypothetical protein
MTPAAQTSEPRTADEIERAIVPHGSNGECSIPDLCVALTDFRLAIEAEAQRPTVERLRDQIRALYDFHPDDSHGEGYRNRGVASALRVIEEAAGREFTDRCQRSDDYRKTAEVWCLTHGGPMGSSLWCDFAEQPWEWRDDGPLDPPTREEAGA